jgi:hypothetical protein
MNNDRKDSGLGIGAGAVAGAIAGAAVGAVGGPVGIAVGAVAGGLVGGKAGDSVADSINLDSYRAHFQHEYSRAPYYVSGRSWEDYEPAYRYAFDARERYPDQQFEQVEALLQQDWDASGMSWEEARPAVRDGWQFIESALPGDGDRDGL